MPSSSSHAVAPPLIESHPLKAIFLASLALPLYFLLLGYFGDDYSFHLSSWLGIVQGWHSGVLFPAWLPQANYGLGEPRFYFYPPSSIYLGAALLVIFPARIVPALMPWLALLASGLSMLKLARHLDPKRATRSALLYISSYYLVITIVMRYAIGEAFVAAVLPLIVLYALRLFNSGRSIINLGLTALLAFAWLTNIPAALVTFYILLFAFALIAASRRTPRPLLAYLLAQALAVGLCAWYLVPAALARVQLTTTSLASKFPWRDYTLFHHPQNPLARSMTWPLWIWAITGFAFILLTTVQRHRSTKNGTATEATWLFLVSLGCLPLLFELPQSGLLWSLPAVKLIAFSVRFLPFLAIALSLFLPRIRTTSLRRAAYTLWIIWMLLPIAERIGRSHVHGTPPSYASVAAELTQPTGGMSEYLPTGIDAPPESPADVASLSQHADACTTSPVRIEPQARQVISHSAQPCLYEPGLFFFPEWLAKIDDRPTPTQRSATGLVQVQLPAGEHRVEVYFERPAQPLLLGAGLTLLTLLLLFASTRWPSGNRA